MPPLSILVRLNQVFHIVVRLNQVFHISPAKSGSPVIGA